MLSKDELYSLNYISKNVTSGLYAINKDRMAHASDETIEEILSSIKEFVSDQNYSDIILSLINAGIKIDGIKTEVSSENSFVVVKKYYQEALIETSTVSYSYNCSNEFQLETEETKANISRLNRKVTALIDSNTLTPNNLESIARSFIRIRNTDSIHISFKRENEKSVKEWIFDKEGFKSRTESINAVIFFKEEKIAAGIRKSTTYKNGLAAREFIRDINHAFVEISETELEYEANQLAKSKTTNYIESTNGNNTTSIVYKYYTNGSLSKVQIKDIKYGRRSYLIKDDSILIAYSTDHELAVSISKSAKEYTVCSDTITALKELDLLEGGLLQLKAHVSEIDMNYELIIPNLHNSKLVLGIKAAKDPSVVVYIADKGNTTLYDVNGTKLAYFPRHTLGSFYKEFTASSNTLYEQSIKNSDKPDLIKMIYWLGSQQGDDKGIYAFHRVVKALVKNPHTPYDVLDMITEGILEGTYDNQNLLAIVQNNNTSSETLNKILEAKPSVHIKEFIDKHPNKPIIEMPSAEDIANKILS